jgi:hypothetical protein
MQMLKENQKEIGIEEVRNELNLRFQRLKFSTNRSCFLHGN